MAPPNFNNPQVISEVGRKIYGDKYQSDYEARYPDQYAAINVLDGSATVGNTRFATLTNARNQYPNGLFHLIRIGHAAAYEVGFSLRHVSSHADRIP